MRKQTVTTKVQTPFRSMYVHVHYDTDGNACGAWISDPGKEPDSTVARLMRDISAALNDALKKGLHG